MRVASLGLGLLALACGTSSGSPANEKTTEGSTREVAAAPAELGPVDPTETRRLARRADPADIPVLRRHLLVRGEARRWAAFGLGQLCSTDRLGISSALAGAFALWVAEAEPPSELDVQTLARALGACASPDTERILRGWLAPESEQRLPTLPEAAALGLGDWVERRGQLEERTVTALLDAAERSKKGELLYPLGRLGSLTQALEARTLDVAGALLTSTQSGSGRSFALLALGSAGASAALPLSLLVLNRDFSGAERALGVATLARLGEAGQRALDSTLNETLERGLPARASDENWLVLAALAKAVEHPDQARKALAELPTAPLPELLDGPGRAQRRRLVALRCRAAELLAGDNQNARPLLECDPDQGTVGRLAQLSVLGRGKLLKARATRFDELARSENPVVLESALRQLPAHPEFTGALELLVHALEKGGPGPAATALAVVAAHPTRAQSGAEPAPDARVVAAIERLLAVETKAPLETVSAALGAAGALGVLTLKPRVEAWCSGSESALWPRAAAALGLLGNPGRACRSAESDKAGPEKAEPAKTGSDKAEPAKTQAAKTEPAKTQAAKAEPGPARTAPATIVIDSELGELRLLLDAPDAPVASARLIAAVESGYYGSAVVDGASPGFAVTWGDRDGDGYENDALPPQPDERGPAPWVAGSVGSSSFAPGAASTLLLVTVVPAPQLTGQKTRLGSATGPWHLLIPGDTLSKARVERPGR
ncbi:MAG TPA: hypothetical protein VLC09_19785 [Polyangiaceae bacterium]|nr:hypothetical protein [Polyangiaceae bacterium]